MPVCLCLADERTDVIIQADEGTDVVILDNSFFLRYNHAHPQFKLLKFNWIK